MACSFLSHARRTYGCDGRRRTATLDLDLERSTSLKKAQLNCTIKLYFFIFHVANLFSIFPFSHFHFLFPPIYFPFSIFSFPFSISTNLFFYFCSFRGSGQRVGRYAPYTSARSRSRSVFTRLFRFVYASRTALASSPLAPYGSFALASRNSWTAGPIPFIMYESTLDPAASNGRAVGK